MCPVCGGPVIQRSPSIPGPQRTYCSLDCQRRNPTRRRQSFSSVWPKDCESCHRPFIARRSTTRFCSARCNDYANGRVPTLSPRVVIETCMVEECEQPHRAGGYCSGHYTRSQKGLPTQGLPYTCTVCGKGMRTALTEAPRCRTCYRRTRKRGASRRETAERRLAKAAAGTMGQRVWTACECPSCGTKFLTSRPRRETSAWYCSKTCQHRESQARRRALTKGAKITPGRRITIYTRDDWICQLCGFPVNRDAQVPALDAPVIDHIVALAVGGAHAPDNWQTAHFLCNSYKRDLPHAA